MLSVVNRGSYIGQDGIGMKLVNGYTTDCYKGRALDVEIIVGIPKPTIIKPFEKAVNGYTLLDLNPTEA